MFHPGGVISDAETHAAADGRPPANPFDESEFSEPA
jgi:hypothetical protein